jgi:hypothetical protein
MAALLKLHGDRHVGGGTPVRAYQSEQDAKDRHRRRRYPERRALPL